VPHAQANADLLDPRRTITITGQYQPPTGPPDLCQTRTGILMRVSPSALTCSPVSIRKSSWGSLKLLYR
jgi:hypothetical protein